ncbi:thioester domain-containing protein [Microbacterium sp. LRZ72]|uniref:thioester domain-containing protein n=1 Tax=Microbacterium sp. LRZ72 TaxID=2942481 RepID=UPI0029A3B8B8|nr:thioester domain-containing protein [Microbacterium sp. LRZ72]MDX2376676.1 thioester domain-containing protein [Microbacterium sp. LRZ72]
MSRAAGLRLPGARTSLRLCAVAAAGLLALAVLWPTAAAAEPGLDAPGATDEPAPATEATVVDMIHQGGLFGGFVPSATATTSYPATGLQDERTVETAQIVLEEPGGGDPILTYCIDLATETEIGVHYELGDWTSANVPNLPYVTHILENYYPQVPGEPALADDAQRVAVVQAAIWYFTDQFVVAPAYAQHDQVRTIVEAAQAALAGGAPPAPPLPTLTVTPAQAEAPTTGELVGPFAVGGSVSSSILSTSGVDVLADASGTSPLSDGATVDQGSELWARHSDATPSEGFVLSTTEPVVQGNVFLYDGGNPGRSSAQKLILAQQADLPLRAAARITPFAAGTLHVDIDVSGAAAGEQGAITVAATCVDDPAAPGRSATLPAGTGAGTARVLTVAPIAAGTVCTVEQTANGANDDVVLTQASIAPASATIVEDASVTITVADVYAAPAPPSPEPSPTHTALPATGSNDAMAWPLPTVLLTAGGGLVLLAALRSRRARS